MEKTSVKNRGLLLTILLVVYTGWIIVTAYSLVTSYNFIVSNLFIPDFIFTFKAFFFLPLHIAILIGLYKWKKIAIYSFFIIFYCESIYKNFIFFSNIGNSSSLSASLVVLSILSILLIPFYIAFRRKWQMFT